MAQFLPEEAATHRRASAGLMSPMAHQRSEPAGQLLCAEGGAQANVRLVTIVERYERTESV